MEGARLAAGTRVAIGSGVRSRDLLVLLSFTSIALACGGPSKPRSPELCPGSKGLPCLTTPICTYDDARQCDVCRCSTPEYVRPQQLDPRGDKP